MTDPAKFIKFTSSRFGELEIPIERVISVPQGILGFPDHHRYVLLDPSDGKSLFLWLQAVDPPDLAFIVTDPLGLVPDYQIQLTEPGLACLNVEERGAPALFVIATVPKDDPEKVNVNLLAPLIYFCDENILYQIVLENSLWPIRHYLLPQKSIDPAGPAPQPNGEEEAGR